MNITNNLLPIIFTAITMVVIFIGISLLIHASSKAIKDKEKGMSPFRRWKYYYLISSVFILGLVILFSGGGRKINNDQEKEEAGIVTMTKASPAELTKKEIKKDAEKKKDKLLKKMDTSNFDEEKAEADKYLKKALKNNN